MICHSLKLPRPFLEMVNELTYVILGTGFKRRYWWKKSATTKGSFLYEGGSEFSLGYTCLRPIAAQVSG